MKTLLGLLLILSFSAQARFDLTNCNSYGPSEQNLTVILDDDQSTGLAIGHAILGNFFPFDIIGCESITLENNKVYCNDKDIGTYKSISLELEDPGYNGPRARVKLFEDAFLLSGSCRPQDGMPLTIQF